MKIIDGIIDNNEKKNKNENLLYIDEIVKFLINLLNELCPLSMIKEINEKFSTETITNEEILTSNEIEAIFLILQIFGNITSKLSPLNYFLIENGLLDLVIGKLHLNFFINI